MAPYEPVHSGQAARDFLVLVRERNAVDPFLDEAETASLRGLIDGNSSDRDVRNFLVAVREKDQHGRFLDDDERARLQNILYPPAPSPPRVRFTPTQNRGQIKTSALIVVVAIFAAALVLMFYNLVAYTPPSGPPVHQPPPPVAEQPLTRNNAQKTQDLFGPWRTITPSAEQLNTAHPAILMLKQGSGTIASTQWTIPAQASAWEEQNSFFIKAKTLHEEYAEIETTRNDKFFVHVDQPFVLEQAPDQVLRIGPDGDTWYMTLPEGIATRTNLPNK